MGTSGRHAGRGADRRADRGDRQGFVCGPSSPQLGKGDRSLSPVLKRLDNHSRTAQRRVLLGLRDSGAVEVVAFKRGGHGSEIRKGLRTPDGSRTTMSGRTKLKMTCCNNLSRRDVGRDVGRKLGAQLWFVGFCEPV